MKEKYVQFKRKIEQNRKAQKKPVGRLCTLENEEKSNFVREMKHIFCVQNLDLH